MLHILLDLHYKFSMNKFEEFYGDSVTYSSIEQESYIDLKEMSFEKINKTIKFRKFGRSGNILTIKMDISSSDYELFLGIVNNEEYLDTDGELKIKKFNFLHDFCVSNMRQLTREEKIKFKKSVDPVEDGEEEEEIIESSIDELIDLEDELDDTNYNDEYL